jgi:hypothetical protein
VRIGAVDAAGNRYENWWTAIHKTTPDGVRTLLAGNPNGPGTADGSGSGAGFGAIAGMAVDAGGTVYVADYLNATIRKVSPSGVVTTLAGSAGQTGTQDGAGAAARFRKPVALALDKAGNVYVDDDTVVRKITPAGVVTTMATVPRWPPAPNDSFPQIAEPSVLEPVVGGLAVAADGSVFVLSGNIRRVSPEGVVSNFVGSAYTWGKYSVLTQDAAGNMYVVDPDRAAVFRVTPAGDISVLAGLPSNAGFADGTGAAARFQPVVSAAATLIADAQGNITLGEGERVRKITSGGLVSTLTLPAVDGSGAPIKYFVSGLVYGKDLLAYSSGLLRSVDMNGNATGTVSVRIGELEDPIVDPKGNIYFRAWEKPQPLVFKAYVRRISPDGTIVTLPLVQEPRFTSWFADRDGNVVMANANGEVLRMAPDGSTSVLRAGASAYDPKGVYGPVAADRSGNLYIAEINVVRKIAPGGTETIVAGTPAILGVRPGPLPASLNRITALAVGDDGNVYIESENAILKLTQ